MKREEFFEDTQHTRLFLQLVEPLEPKAVVILVHGLGEHSGRYLEGVVPALLEASCAVLLYDNIGHGKSGGKRGHCPGYEALLDILGFVLTKAQQRFPELPVFLYGHSMGGNLVLNYALRYKPDIGGLIVTSPYLKLAFKPPAWKMFLGKLMLKLYPSLTLPSGLDPKGISTLTEEVEKYQNDPLIHDKVSPMFSFPVMDAGIRAIRDAHLLQLDTLLFHGSEDPIIAVNGTREFHNNSTQTTLKIFEGCLHELHYDHRRSELFTEIRNWLQKQL
ncbi:alpha/beta hydrolase [Poritiphilus flavus]|uniref:Alpha/beta fold hydrolase n=1 Tax=Poritiphilus flavus TaxID=2697053 RepID=A0A6L9EE91_9FLAO|nr:alpha/beta fold hydrolase [Poritiphilus flavus]NAS13060.1 alpha/beta fold hydrolase [Poritiphilus flavus]